MFVLEDRRYRRTICFSILCTLRLKEIILCCLVEIESRI